MLVDDYEDRSYNKGEEESLKNILSEEVTSEPTKEATSEPITANILHNDLQWGQRAVLDFFSGLGFVFNMNLP
jgi:hypothetical protein